MERFQSGIFRRIVIIHMLQALVLSVTGIVDSAIVGQFWEADSSLSDDGSFCACVTTGVRSTLRKGISC